MDALYLDIGNTTLKLASPDKRGWNILWSQRLGVNFESFITLLNEHKEKGGGVIYMSSVRKDITLKIKTAASDIDIQVLSPSQIPKTRIHYSTTQTLGLDRFLVCLGAFHLSKRSSVIVIDTGSACTVDFMDKRGTFQGGVIMPGIEILRKSIQRYLPELPQVDAKLPADWPGKSTKESLQWGVYGMFSGAIKNWIRKYRSMDRDAKVFITGGNSEDLQELLADTQIVRNRYLQFEGMKIFAEEVKS